MATVIRKRYNSVLCSTSKPTLGASLTNSGTTITFAAALKKSDGSTDIPTLGTDEYLPIILEPDTSAEEIVYLTAYTAGATTGTISRGQEGSTGVAHSNGVSIAFGPTAADFDGKGGGAGLIGLGFYNPATMALYTLGTSFADVDATNLTVTFVAPPSGKVLTRTQVWCDPTASNSVKINLRDSVTGNVVGTAGNIAYTEGNFYKFGTITGVVTGLTPGTSYTWRLGARSNASLTNGIRVGGSETADDAGPFVCEIWAVNL